MDMSQTAMVFFSSDSTPLFLRAWTPSGSRSYTCACIFIAVLAVIHRVLIAVRNIVFGNLPIVIVRHEKSGPWPPTVEDEATSCLSHYDIANESFQSGWTPVQRQPLLPVTTEAVLKALCETVISLVGHLVMLAAMTMNVGYFLSALGGTFIGSLLAGRFSTTDAGSCH
ncbi:uncharacterized protein PG986_011300 [Apiospora aurea]|uniref:Copper transport protein n=1 Tax=Apiospora aurea TaxID=335848 RepID=A0ABR1Q4N1_9PEZI